VAMEPGRKDKAPAPAEAWDLAVVEKQKAAKDAAGDKAAVVARDGGKVKGAAGGKGKARDEISELRVSGDSNRKRPLVGPLPCRTSTGATSRKPSGGFLSKGA